eukprot:TRINITY_DN5401_c0_g1_i1.p1 TRINITY_DN5401_c0_g1~~TRINITY_DN5401_c0_g1_i1.p1  ORF type:complete len:405 (-),score=80.37 TRINITY_DN5401_c0_g1_i1:143-1330(-)
MDQQTMDATLEIGELIQKFLLDPSQNELVFPPTYDNVGRKKIHLECERLRIKSESRQIGADRCVVVSKDPKPDVHRITPSMKRRFLKDYMLPFPTVKAPYFDYYLETYDALFATKSKYAYLIEAIQDAGGENQFVDFEEKLKASIIADIKATNAYKELEASAPPNLKYPPNYPPSTEVYRPDNAGKTFVSLDLRSANFSTLRRFNPALVFGCTSWVQLMERYTKAKYLHGSKMFRQLVFSKLGSKRQASLIGSTMLELHQKLISSGLLRPEDFVCRTNDEFFIQVDESQAHEIFANIEKCLRSHEAFQDLGDLIRVEVFRLVKLGQLDYYVKERIMPTPSGGLDGIEFKCISPAFFPQVFKHYTKGVLDHRDLKFEYEGHIASFDEPIYVNAATK